MCSFGTVWIYSAFNSYIGFDSIFTQIQFFCFLLFLSCRFQLIHWVIQGERCSCRVNVVRWNWCWTVIRSYEIVADQRKRIGVARRCVRNIAKRKWSRTWTRVEFRSKILTIIHRTISIVVISMIKMNKEKLRKKKYKTKINLKLFWHFPFSIRPTRSDIRHLTKSLIRIFPFFSVPIL